MTSDSEVLTRIRTLVEEGHHLRSRRENGELAAETQGPHHDPA